MSRFWRITRLGARSLMLHPLRSFLTALGIIIGVGTVIQGWDQRGTISRRGGITNEQIMNEREGTVTPIVTSSA